MLKTKLRRTSLIVLAVVLMLSVFSMTAFAEEETIPANDDVSVDIAAPTLGEAAPEADVDVAVDAEAAADADVADTDVADTDVADTEIPEIDVPETEEIPEVVEGEKLTTSDIVSLVILGVVIIAVVAYCVIKHEKVGKFFRGLKSEFKKIVWSPWEQVRKNTIVVVIIVVAIAILIGALDTVFNKAIMALGKLSK